MVKLYKYSTCPTISRRFCQEMVPEQRGFLLLFLKRLRILNFICRVRGKREGKLLYGATDALSRIGSRACVQAYQIAKRTRNHVIDCVSLS